MNKKQSDRNANIKPTERHLTASWANASKFEPLTNVAIPSEFEVENAKEWVDSNQK